MKFNALTILLLAASRWPITTPEGPRFLPLTEQWQTNRPIESRFIAYGGVTNGVEVTRETVTNAAAVLSILDAYWERNEIARNDLMAMASDGKTRTNLWWFAPEKWPVLQITDGPSLAQSYPLNRETSPTIRQVEARRLKEVESNLGFLHSQGGSFYLAEAFGCEKLDRHVGTDGHSSPKWPVLGWGDFNAPPLGGFYHDVEMWLKVWPTWSAVESERPHLGSYGWGENYPASRPWLGAWDALAKGIYQGGWFGMDWPNAYRLFKGNAYDPVMGGNRDWSRTFFPERGIEYRYAIEGIQDDHFHRWSAGLELMLPDGGTSTTPPVMYELATQTLNKVYLRQDRRYLGALNSMLADCEWDIRTPEPDTLPVVATNVDVEADMICTVGDFTTNLAGFQDGVLRILRWAPGAMPSVYGIKTNLSARLPRVARSSPRCRFPAPGWTTGKTIVCEVQMEGYFDAPLSEVWVDWERETGGEIDGFFFDVEYGRSAMGIYSHVTSLSNVVGDVTNVFTVAVHEERVETDRLSYRVWPCDISLRGKDGVSGWCEHTASSDRDADIATNAAARALWDCGALTSIETATAEGMISQTNVVVYSGEGLYWRGSWPPAPPDCYRRFRTVGESSVSNVTEHARLRRQLLDGLNHDVKGLAYDTFTRVLPSITPDVVHSPEEIVVRALAAVIRPHAIAWGQYNADHIVQSFAVRMNVEDFTIEQPRLQGYAEIGEDSWLGRRVIRKVTVWPPDDPARRRECETWVDYDARFFCNITPFEYNAEQGEPAPLPPGGAPYDVWYAEIGADGHQGLAEKRHWNWHNLQHQK